MIDIDVGKARGNYGDMHIFSYRGDPGFEDITFEKPLSLNATYSFINEQEIAVNGSFETTVRAQCVRCLCDVSMTIHHDFHEVFHRSELEDGENYTWQNEILSLDQLVRDAIVLGMPQKLLCSEDCKGLCQDCGKNLNEGTCTCEQSDDFNPFAQLKDLYKNDGGVE